MNLLTKTTLAILTGMALFSSLPMTAAETPAGTKITRKLLSSHDTIATFDSLKEHRCMGRTALCPDRCGDSGTMATFSIIKYLDYQKPGKYGDPQAKTFSFLISKAGPELVKGLQTGDTVRLSWNHDYVTRTDAEGRGGSSPERPVLKIQKLTREEANALMKGQPKAPDAAAILPDLTVTGEVPAALDSFDGVAEILVFEYNPMLADAPATRIGNQDIPVKHVKGTATAIKTEFAVLKPKTGNGPMTPRHYTVVNVFADAGKTKRVMGTGDFCKIFEKGAPDSVKVKLVPAN
jgi:hypothetical protein